MPQTLLEMAKELTHTLVETGRLSVEDMQVTLQKTHATLSALKALEEPDDAAAVSVGVTPPVDWRKSITRHTVTCLECGIAYKQLPHRHLQTHGLDLRSYRIKFGIPQSVRLVARATTERHRQVVRQTRPWERAPAYRRRQTRNGHPSPEPEAETMPDEAEAPTTAAASAQPKRQRKTTTKKTSSRKMRP